MIWGRKIALYSAVPALGINLMLIMPLQHSHAAASLPAERPVAYSMSEEELQNMEAYQQSSPAVVSIVSGKNQGAGVILSPDGLIVTNRHVTLGAKTVMVQTCDGNSYEGKSVGEGDASHDLAFLKISSNQSFPYIRLGDSTAVRVGQRVLAIGSPFGLNGTMTTGIISRIDTQRNVLQTDAAINPGNSGGALLNTQGELIGINRSIVNPVGPSSAGISFAVPVNEVKLQAANVGFNVMANAQKNAQ